LTDPQQPAAAPTPAADSQEPLRTAGSRANHSAAHFRSLPGLFVVLMTLAYTVFFSAYSLQRHSTLNSYAADLSFIDQPMWNTLHGHFLERTMDARQVSRVAEHLEPVIIPVALVFFLWDDVRAILIVQTVALALGALPVYWIARRTFAAPFGVASTARAENEQSSQAHSVPRWRQWLPVVFVFTYLMYPALQAANVADFHADPFIVAPLLFSFWYATQRRYSAMWAWAAVGLMVKENLPTLIVTLGMFLLVFGGRTDAAGESPAQARRRRLHGAGLIVVGLAWFYVATYLVVAPLAGRVYGTGGPIYMAHRYSWLDTGLSGLWEILHQPERLRYLAELFAPVGWLPLLAPEYLLLGLPVLVANLLSDFSGQYSGQQHYTAPLVPVFVVAAVFGARRLIDVLPRAESRVRQFRLKAQKERGERAIREAWRLPMVAALVVWLLAWSLGYQALRGWTPLGRDYTWPQGTAHQELLARFIAQIPPEAAVSTTPPLHPHLAHRWKIYIYPTIADADYVLLDLASRTDAHPNDVHKVFEQLVTTGEFGILDAADGYVLLARGRTGLPELPDGFYDFVRAGGRQPQYPQWVEFAPSRQDAPRLRMLGYDIVDDPVWRQTGLRLYWQVMGQLAQGTRVWPFLFGDDGVVIEDTSQRPMVAPLWYPPSRWRPGETIVTETLPWPLGERFNIGVAVLGSNPGGAASGLPDPAHRFAVVGADASVEVHQDRTWAHAGTFSRTGFGLLPTAGNTALSRLDVSFEKSIRLVGYRYQADGSSLAVVLAWQAEAPIERDYAVFVHLLAADGRIVSQSDAQPHWGGDWPTSRWVPGERVLDGHRLVVPPAIPPGPYQVHVGLYSWPALERLQVLDASGEAIADYAGLETIPSLP
jgi:uncharacterized membrane protein